MYGHWQTAPTGVLDGQGHSLCHVPLQLALEELTRPEDSIAAAGGVCTHPHGHVPGLTSAVRIEHQFVRPPFTSPILNLEKEPFGHILMGSDNTTTNHTSARWSDHQTLRAEAKLCWSGAPFCPRSWVLRLGINDKLAVAGGTCPHGPYRVNPRS